jgi:hypothetical protein
LYLPHKLPVGRKELQSVVQSISNYHVSSSCYGDVTRLIKFTLFRSFTTKREQEATTFVEDLNAMVARVRYENATEMIHGYSWIKEQKQLA